MPKTNRNTRANGKPKRTGRSRLGCGPVGHPLDRGILKSIEQIAREQGKELRPWSEEDSDRMVALGKSLFRSDKEREEFFAGIEERRRQDRGK